MMRGKFASPGVSETADQARRLLKDGTLNALSLLLSRFRNPSLFRAAENGPSSGRRWKHHLLPLVWIPARS